MRIRISAKTSVVLSIIAAVLANPVRVCAAETAATERATKAGIVVGDVGPRGGLRWLGIPYAAPPVGDLRWRAPRPPFKWNGARDALQPGSPCSQPSFPLPGQPLRSPTLTGSEDCLYLNVWTPEPTGPDRANRARRWPVMLWIHGGANVLGEGGRYDGEVLATTQQVVIVTVNYRLGVFGWFRHPSLRGPDTDTDDRSGNFGTLDVIAALRWVHDNIAAFGGDPGNVTVFGESAGGQNVYALMSSPRAAGLFERAIVQSGGTQTASLAEAENAVDGDQPGSAGSSTEVLFELLQRDSLATDRRAAISYVRATSPRAIADYLRTKTYAEFMAAYTALSSRPGFTGAPQMFRDGDVLPAHGILPAFAAGRFNRVPLIAGSNRDEWSVLLRLAPRWVRVDVKSGTAMVPDKVRFALAVEYLSNILKVTGVDEPASLIRRHQPESVYLYRFDWDALSPAPWLDGVALGATHGLDVPFVFGHRDLGREFISIPLIAEKQVASYLELSRTMMSYWSQFAASGDPGRGRHGTLRRWPSWSEDVAPAHALLLLDAQADCGVRVQSSKLTKRDVLERLASDGRFPSLQARCSFLRDLVATLEPFQQLTLRDYEQFAAARCERLQR